MEINITSYCTNMCRIRYTFYSFRNSIAYIYHGETVVVTACFTAAIETAHFCLLCCLFSCCFIVARSCSSAFVAFLSLHNIICYLLQVLLVQLLLSLCCDNEKRTCQFLSVCVRNIHVSVIDFYCKLTRSLRLAS